MTTPLALAAARSLARIEAFLDQRAGQWHQSRVLADAARTLSERYTADVRMTPASAVDGDEVGSLAYLAFFGPRAICATSAALASCGAPSGTVVDAGCGSGAAALLLAEAGAARVVGIDTSESALSVARALVGERLRTVCASIDRAPVTADATLVSSSFAFGELPGDATAAWAAMLRLGGVHSELLIVDAGDHRHARRLQAVREALRGQTPASHRVLAPCPHDDACPALVRDRDWCHSRARKSLTPRLAAFARAVGRDQELMAFAFLAVSAASAPPAAPRRGVLVIGEPHKEKGRVRAPVCGPGGVRFLQALKRDRAAFDAVLALERGARLHAEVAAGASSDTAHLDASRLRLLSPPD